MDRRLYLALVASTALAGCGSGPGDESDSDITTTTTATTTTTTETTSETETTTETETTEPATFEVVGTSAPDRVRVNEEHTISIEVRNTGGEEGTFEATLQVSTAGNSNWEDVGQITVEDIPPGSTKTWTSDPFSFEQPYQVQFQLAEYDSRVSYEVFLPDVDISFGASRMVEVDIGYDTRRMAEMEVVNASEIATKRFTITVDWYDDGAEYLASTKTYIETIDGGETWIPRADPEYDVDDASSVADFKPNLGNVKAATSLNPEGVTVTGDEMVASEQQVIVRGAAKNERDNELDYIGVIAKVYNSDGAVIGSDWTNEVDISAGGQFQFELEPDTRGRNAAVDSYKIVLSDSSVLF